MGLKAEVFLVNSVVTGGGAIRRSALVGQVIATLRQAIESGRWPVDTRLPTEAELADEYGVSRATLRQAVQALVHVGLLQTIQGNGTFVRATSEVDAVLARYLAGENVLAVLEVREAIEVVAAGLAAERRSDTDLAIIVDAFADQTSAQKAGDSDADKAASARFHTAIVNACGNPILQHFYAAMQVGATRAIAVAGGPQTPTEFLGEHRGIIDAIRDGDPDLARQRMQQHIKPTIEQHRGEVNRRR